MKSLTAVPKSRATRGLQLRCHRLATDSSLTKTSDIHPASRLTYPRDLVRQPMHFAHRTCWQLVCGILPLLLLGSVTQVAAQSLSPNRLPPPLPEVSAIDTKNQGKRILDVRITGQKRVDRNKIVARLKTRPDRPFDPDLVQADAQELMLMKEFRNVRPYIQETDGGVVVTFEVEEKPRLKEVRYFGNRAITDRVLRKETGLTEGDALDLYSVKLAQQRIEELYKRKGYPRTEVTIVEGDDSSDGVITFLINEDVVQKIYDVEFVGNQFVSGARLASFIKSKPGIFSPVYRNRFTSESLGSDKQRLTAYYRNFGFFNAIIDTEVEYNDDHSAVTVRFVIDEGPRYQVRNVSLAGNEIYTSSELVTLIELSSGMDFNGASMTRDVNTLKDLYGSHGYIEAEVVAEPLFLEEPGQIDLVYKISEGEQFRVGRINVHIGGEYGVTKQNVVLSRLDLRPGDIIDIRKIRESERRLAASGLFLTDPAQGQQPRIEIRPRENSFEESLRAARNDFRGQSPDATTPGRKDLDLYVPAFQEPASRSFLPWNW